MGLQYGTFSMHFQTQIAGWTTSFASDLEEQVYHIPMKKMLPFNVFLLPVPICHPWSLIHIQSTSSDRKIQSKPHLVSPSTERAGMQFPLATFHSFSIAFLPLVPLCQSWALRHSRTLFLTSYPTKEGIVIALPPGTWFSWLKGTFKIIMGAYPKSYVIWRKEIYTGSFSKLA